ncbi:MAG: hydrogenase maturation protease [Candidatus Altiarchaeota archaeon]|nr:hydrogenase maturation protease [Candidatus Altiarchaeota archaeon]
MIILAIGNELRGDDGVGIYAGQLLENKGFPVVFGYENPENVFNQLDSDKIIVLDAAHYEGQEPFKITNKLSDSSYSHRPGLAKLAKFLQAELVLLGIKTYNRSLRDELSQSAKRNAELAVKVIEVCMAIPAIFVDKGLVSIAGQEKKVRSVVPELKKGDFVLVHASVVIEKLSKQEYEVLKQQAAELSCSL